MQDEIKRSITIKAAKERVYAAIAEPDQIVKWFPSAIEGGLNVGDQPILDFGGHGKNRIAVVAAQPHEYFAYRWVPGAAHFEGDVLSVPNTLVEFRITESDGVSTVTVTETGFSKLPTDRAEEQFKQNSGGWEFMIARLGKLFE
jgi:uncharacterized protein YndB with AHSA1/START domain